MVNQHSKSITKPQFVLQLHIALQQEFFQKVLFVEKYSCAHYPKILKWHPGKPCIFYGG